MFDKSYIYNSSEFKITESLLQNLKNNDVISDYEIKVNSGYENTINDIEQELSDIPKHGHRHIHLLQNPLINVNIYPKRAIEHITISINI